MLGPWPCWRGGKWKADKAAKEASTRPPEATHRAIPHTDMRRPLREAVMSGWHRKWNALGREGSKLREIKTESKQWPSSFNKNRCVETVFARLRLGHTNITHAYLMQGLSDPPECDICSCPITVKHLLLDCRKFSAIRSKYYNNPSLSEILAEGKGFCPETLINYLKESGIFNKI